MKDIIIQCKLMPKGICLNLFGTLWANDISWIDEYVINHERIHTAQEREMIFVVFYVVYIVEWFIKLLRYGDLDKAYMNISFEKEAYAYGNDLTYLKKRKHYAQWRK